jgi:hypothetical protein
MLRRFRRSSDAKNILSRPKADWDELIAATVSNPGIGQAMRRESNVEGFDSALRPGVSVPICEACQRISASI